MSCNIWLPIHWYGGWPTVVYQYQWQFWSGLALAHPVPCEINIWYVLIPHQVTIRFLRDNPTETTLMLVKDEQHNNAIEGDLNFSNLVWSVGLHGWKCIRTSQRTWYTGGDQGRHHLVPQRLARQRLPIRYRVFWRALMIGMNMTAIGAGKAPTYISTKPPQTTLPAWLTRVATRTVSSASYRTLMPWLIICIRVWVRMPPVDCVCSGWCSLIWHQMTSSVTWSSATFRLLDEWDAMVIFRIWTYQWKFMSWANMILGELNSEKYSYCAMYIRNSFFLRG